MALVLKDRVLETCSAPGTGAVTLLGAVTGYQTFSSAIGNANTCYYTIADQNGANWEVGIGTYATSGNTLTRTTVLSSSNAGSTVNFATGTQNVFVTYPSERSVNLSSSALTSGRVTYATTDGLLTDSANMTFDGNNLYVGTTSNTGKLIVNGNASVPMGGQVSNIQTNGTDTRWSYQSTVFSNANSYAFGYFVGKSRGTSVGSYTAVQNGDGLGQYTFAGTDGTNFIPSASMFGIVDTTPSTGIVPTALAFSTMNSSGTFTERMRITSGGALAVNTTGVTSGWQMAVNGAFYAVSSVSSTSGDPNFNAGGSRTFMDWNGSNSRIGSLTGGSTGGPVVFFVNGGETMRIDTSNNVLVGGTTQTNTAKVESFFSGSTNAGFVANDTASASGTNYFIASNNGTNIGSIQRVAATSAVVFNTTSDERLKSNISDAEPILDKLMTVKVRQFDWTDGDLHQDAGFIAQELAPILSGIVFEGKTEKDMWQLDYSRLTPYLVKAMQEQQALIESLTTRLTALESK